MSFLRPAHHLAPLKKAKSLVFSLGPVKISSNGPAIIFNFASFCPKMVFTKIQSYNPKQALRLFQMAEKLSFCLPPRLLAPLYEKPTGLFGNRSALSFFPPVAQLHNSKKPKSGHKNPNFRFIPKSLNEF